MGVLNKRWPALSGSMDGFSESMSGLSRLMGGLSGSVGNFSRRWAVSVDDIYI